MTLEMKCNEENLFVIGKCERMCSLAEEKLREKENLLHFYEKQEDKSVIAEFKRSAADKSLAKPDELRTFEALRNTLNYLINR
jgi:SAC3 domain-containing protein 1